MVVTGPWVKRACAECGQTRPWYRASVRMRSGLTVGVCAACWALYGYEAFFYGELSVDDRVALRKAHGVPR